MTQELNEIQKTILQQCNYNQIRVNTRLKLGKEDNNKIHILDTRTHKLLIITYDEGSDVYNIETIKLQKNPSETTSNKITDVRCNELITNINQFFDTKIPELNWG